MLTPDQIDVLRDLSGQVVDPIVEFLIEDIARRVSEAGQLTGTASYQVWRLQQLGVSQKQIKKEIQRRLKVSEKEVERLLTQAAEVGYDFDISRFPNLDALPFSENTSLQQILDATVKLAQDDLTNITQTIGFVTPDGQCLELTKAYQKTCDFAFQKVVTGAQDYTSAIRDATRYLSEKGIRTIDYESGIHTSLEAAVRRNIMGGLGLMQEQITQQNHDDLGCDGWEISAHGGCAPDHEPIQGRQYSDKEYERLNNSLVRRIGTLNCGHSAMPIILGVNEPKYTPEELEKFREENEKGIDYEGKHYTLYEATQRQRSLERSIRKTKRKILIDEATGDAEKLQWDQIRLVRTREEYHRFSKAAGLPEQFERMEKAGFTWKHGKAAEKAAIDANNKQQKSVSPSGQRKSIQKAKSTNVNKAIGSKSITEKRDAVSAVTWDDARGSQSWKKDSRKKLFSAEWTSTQSPVEIGTLYGADGKRIFRLKGDGSSVEFTDSQVRQMRGGVLTHNHPGADYGCFSPADINMLREGYLSEMRLATPVGVFSVQRPKKWPSNINSLEKIREAYYDIDKPIGGDYMARAFRGEMSLLDADNQSQRAVIEEMCRRYKIPFRFDTWDDIRKE